MARTPIPVTALTTSAGASGVAIPAATDADVPNGMSVLIPSGYLLIEVDNQGGVTLVTLETVGTYLGLAVADLEIALAASARAMIGPFESRMTGILGSAGVIHVNVASAGVKLRAFSVSD
jgi:hypothetical protein